MSAPLSFLRSRRGALCLPHAIRRGSTPRHQPCHCCSCHVAKSHSRKNSPPPRLSLWYNTRSKQILNCKADARGINGDGEMSLIGNILWSLLLGVEAAKAWIVTGLLFCCTIRGVLGQAIPLFSVDFAGVHGCVRPHRIRAVS